MAKLPALHGLGPVFPPEQYLVTGHVSQSASETKVTPEGRKVPGKHAAGMRTLVPGGQYQPSPQLRQCAAPRLGWYVVAGH